MAETEDPGGELTRLRLDVAYDGTAFSGWSRQPGLRTVQGVLEDALATVFRRRGGAPRLTVAGRTDAGVHAAGQVCHLDLDGERERALLALRGGRTPFADAGEALAYRLNGILGLGSDVVVTGGAVAPGDFDARFSAVWRRYRYRVADTGTPRDPLQRHRTLRHPRPLDVEAMDEAAASLEGLHDFAAFCKPREGATTIRTLQSFGWGRDGEGVLVAALQADAFCHSMVRALVGACIAVGEGRLAPGDLVGLRDAGERTSRFIVVPARGLTLMEVGYPPPERLAARAEQTRARRRPTEL